MNRKQITAGMTVVVLGAAVYALLRLARGPAAAASEAETPTVVTVQTGRLQRITLHEYVEGIGAVVPAPAEAGQPPATSHVAASVPGVVAKALVPEGQLVARGAALFELDDRAARVAVNYALETAQRQKKLYAEANTSLRSLQDAEAQLATARAQLALLQVTAPLAGTVTRVNVRPGEAVDLSTVLADITDLDRLVVSAEIPSVEAGRLRPGQALQVLTSPAVATAVTYISPAVDPANDTVVVRAPLPSGTALRPGESVRLRVVTAEHPQCLAAPAESVVTNSSGQEVIAVAVNEEATQVPVKTGLREGGWVEIEGAGLTAGYMVVTVGAYGLPEKTKVRVVTP